MKKILLFGVIILLFIIGGYFLYVSSGGRETVVIDDDQMNEGGEIEVTGVVTSIDLEQMAVDGPGIINVAGANENYVIAVPSMGIRLCPAFENITSVGVIAVGDQVRVRGSIGVEEQIIPCESADHVLEVISTFIDEDETFSFEYRKGPNGLVAVVADTTQAFSGISLFPQAEYEQFSQFPEGREGPPAITVGVYDNPLNQSAAIWADDNPQLTNSNLATGSQTEVVVGGANAVTYVADGLWTNQVYVVADSGRMYVIIAALPLEYRDLMQTELARIVETMTFLPPVAA